MPKSVSDKITELDYNTLQDDIAIIMGPPAGSTETDATGYNQALSSSQISVGNNVTAAQWDNLRSDITKAYIHQFGTTSPPTITNVGVGDKITAAIYNQYETLIDTVSNVNNRFLLASDQRSPLAGQTATLSTGWNGIQYHQFTATFGSTPSSSTARKAFFNAGGVIRINLSLSYTGSESKTLDWKQMMSDLGTVSFNYKETTYGSGAVDSTGNYNVTSTTWQRIASEAGANPYSENDILIDVRQNNASQLEFRITLREDDTGDQQLPGSNPGADGVIVPGPAVDENVKGTTTSTITTLTPTGSNVSVPGPTFAAAAGNTFTITA
jgi:hypothetical protein